MIIVLTGSNTFAVRQTLRQIVEDSAVEPERYEASDIEPAQLVDILQGQSLFADRRLVIIDEPGQEKSLWSSLKDSLPRANPDTTLVLVATSLDKRTATYKWLQKQARIVDHPLWTGSDTARAERWLSDYAQQRSIKLPSQVGQEMVRRATRSADDGKPIIDQQQLANAIEQLKYGEQPVTIDQLDAVLTPSSHENIFELLSAALNHETGVVQSMIDHLSQTEDGHRAMGLLVSQMTNLVALTLADDSRSVDQIAGDIGAHPYALKQTTDYVGQLSKSQLTAAVRSLADADVRLKRSEAEPWTLIRTALLSISQNK